LLAAPSRRSDGVSVHQLGGAGMRASVLGGLIAVLLAASASAKDESPDSIKGLYLTTAYPALTIRAGEETTLPLTLYNYGLAPQRAAIGIADAPPGWKTEIDGDGKPVSAAFVDYDGRAAFDLKLTIPADAKPGPYKFTLDANGDAGKSSLPIAINLEAPLAAKLTATPKFPELKGTAKSSFDFNVTVKNQSENDMTLALGAKAPPGFTATFKEQYGSQELTSLPIKANESKDLTVSIKPSPDAEAGKVPVMLDIVGDKVKAQTKLTLDIGGQPSLVLSGPDDRLSGDAYAGQERSIPLTVRNIGSAPALGVALDASPPTGWKVSFEPKTLPPIPAGGEQKLNALVTPNPKAIAGDYMLDLNADGDGVSQSISYRVTVLTSTLWGVTGLGVIAAALLVLFGAVGRYGRR
jgi:uncharacterized membrane protein